MKDARWDDDTDEKPSTDLDLDALARAIGVKRNGPSVESKIREQHRSQIVGLTICAMLCLTLLGVVWMFTH